MHFLRAGFVVIMVFVTSSLIPTTESAQILFLHHLATHSHLVATWNFAKALVAKGHNVSYITSVPPPSNNPAIPYIIPKRLNEHFQAIWDSDFDVTTRMEGKVPLYVEVVEVLNTLSCELLLGSEELQSWLETNPKVDLIYADGHPECAAGLAFKLKAKLAIFEPYGILPKYFENLGIPYESSSIPAWELSYKTPMSFMERVKTTLIPLAWRWKQIEFSNQIENSIKQHLQIDFLPPIDDLAKSISLILTNGHFLDEYRRSLPALVVNVPGMHVKEAHDPLLKELEDFINSPSVSGQPSEGFIYISLGTLAKAPKLPQNVREVFYNSIRAFPDVRFLWRWDGEFPSDIPKNLKLSKWFNQQDLLGHSKIKGFVSQVGRPSSQEAVYNAVPLITLPILGDQDFNAHVLESLGVSINLEIVSITEEELTNAFRRILHDQRLKTRVNEVSQLYKDLPMKPLDTAVWWTEYVLRHKDTSHLKPLAIDQTWYEKRLLDVWAFIVIFSLAFIYISCVISVSVLKLIEKFMLKVINDALKTDDVLNNNVKEKKMKIIN